MKLLTLVCVVQTIAIALLVITTHQLANKVEVLHLSVQEQKSSASTSTLGVERTPYSIDTATIEQIRNTIREELRAQTAGIETSEEHQTELSQADYQTDQISSAEDITSVNESIEYFISAGKISEYEMGSLQAKILRLDKTNKKEMFKKLFEALNNGQLEGHL